jgi:hypothetical protein
MRALPTLLFLLALNLVLGLLLFRQQASFSPLPPPDPAIPRLVLLSELPGASPTPVPVQLEPAPNAPVVTGILDTAPPAPGTVVSAVTDPTLVSPPAAPRPAPTPPPASPPAVVASTPEPPPAIVDVPPPEPRPEPPPAVVSTLPPPAERCLRLVGFGDQLAAQRAQRRLQTQVDEAKLHTRTERNVRSYWVYLPPSANRQAALETSRRLAEKGLSDFFVTTAGANPNAISLGVFSSRANAERRQKQVVSAGFAAEIAERAEETQIHDLDLRWRREEPLDWARALPDFRGLRAEALNCPPRG